MDIANWPMRKPLAIFAAAIVGIAIGSALWRGCDLPDNLTALIQWFGSITIVAYFASSTTEAVKGVGVNAYTVESSAVEMDAAVGVNCTDTRGSDSVSELSGVITSTDTANGRRFASSPQGFIGKYPKGRKHLR